jgi:hypothetical protein
MIIDLSSLESKEAKVFNSNLDEVLADYQALADDLQKRTSDLPWLLNNVTSRNTNFSKLLYYMRCEKMLFDIAKDNTIEKVITDDVVLANLLKSKYNVDCKAEEKKTNRFRMALSCLKWSFYAFFCRSKERLNRLQQSEGATIIDTDIAKKTDKYNDRYYGDVLDTIAPEKTKDFFYNIIYLPLPKKKDILQIDKKTPYNTIYLWDFLEPQDYFVALFGMLKRNHTNLLDYNYLGINQRPALKAIYNDSNSFYYYLAYLYERVIYRMREKGVKMRLYIDWFENQSFDKSFHWAMKRYFPEVPVHSYIGFMADTKSNPITIASNTELELGIAPENVFTCNKALYDQYKESGYKGNVEVAPFYRAETIWSIEPAVEKQKNFTMLVPLGLNNEEVHYKVKMLKTFVDSNVIHEVEVILKPHPVYNNEIIKDLLGDTKEIKIVGGNIYDYLPAVNAVVASNSTTTYEALALGKPLLYLLDPDLRVLLNKPNGLSDDMWYEVSDAGSFAQAVNKVQELSDSYLREEGERLKNYYFTKNTKELTNKLFAL